MSIRPVDFNGMMQRSQDVSSVKHAEDNKAVVQQQQIGHLQEEKTNQKLRQVNQSDEKENAEGKYDAREEGKNKYFASRDKKKKKQQTVDSVRIKNESSGFDISI